ncbi:ROK family protein [Actinotalea sp. M2MS4P-6]|uniref:ROK family protein n=1 Tax=Actinotalea sp. M2MS4P-6 TaxID=2983762 RepID=UPI0021E46B12|nr:ROK family protein [Actinotalea sp. M2MS4P-6]MCV2393878.1 ROK family protein [Actinotalea sp. M2MS4P-6]
MKGPSDVAEIRRANLALTLQTLDELAPCSRTDLRHATGLVSGSVSSLVDELVARGLVVEPGQTTSNGRGRPRRVLGLNPLRVVGVAVQLTPLEVIAEVRDLGGELRWQVRQPHGIRHGVSDDLVAALVDAALQAEAAAAQIAGAWVCGTVVGVPGPVASGRVLADSIEFGTPRTDLFEPLRERLPAGRDLVVMNDGRLGAVAEYSAIPPRERPRSMAYLTGGKGVSGGLIVAGMPHLGAHLMAGECGHISVAMDGPPCDCGARGCLTLYLGTDALFAATDLTTLAADRGQDVALVRLEERLAAGDADARTALDRAGRALASAIGTMSNYTDIDLVVLGGALPRLERWLLAPVTELLDARQERIPEFNPVVASARRGDGATLIGAWLLARQRLMADPSRVPLLGG